MTKLISEALARELQMDSNHRHEFSVQDHLSNLSDIGQAIRREREASRLELEVLRSRTGYLYLMRDKRSNDKKRTGASTSQSSGSSAKSVDAGVDSIGSSGGGSSGSSGGESGGGSSGDDDGGDGESDPADGGQFNIHIHQINIFIVNPTPLNSNKQTFDIVSVAVGVIGIIVGILSMLW